MHQPRPGASGWHLPLILDLCILTQVSLQTLLVSMAYTVNDTLDGTLLSLRPYSLPTPPAFQQEKQNGYIFHSELWVHFSISFRGPHQISCIILVTYMLHP